MLGSGTQVTKINVQAYAAVPTALNSLPGLPQEFTGRDEEVAKIVPMLHPGSGSGAAVASVAGLPGVGETTLAHAVGHAALGKGWFTAVQMVNLRGYDPTPVPPEDALEALLRALGVAAEHIPPTLDEREGLYRSQLDALAQQEQRVLILADNASTSDQVQPLLSARHHAVLVTSRHTLPGLGARLFNLHPLQPDAAVDLLHQRLEVADPDDRRVCISRLAHCELPDLDGSRHTAGTTLNELGVDMPTIMEILRNTQISQTRRYMKGRSHLSKDAMRRMGEFFVPAPTTPIPGPTETRTETADTRAARTQRRRRIR